LKISRDVPRSIFYRVLTLFFPSSGTIIITVRVQWGSRLSM